MAMAKSVAAHTVARELLAEGIAEGVIRTDYCGLPCQSRIDWLHPRYGIVDLKSTEDLTWMEADSMRYGYAHQLAFYRAMIAKAGGGAAEAHIIAVEKKEPFRAGVWTLSTQLLDQCQRENEAAIERLKRCMSSDFWPTNYEEKRVLDLT
jgi:hypothetical protein